MSDRLLILKIEIRRVLKSRRAHEGRSGALGDPGEMAQNILLRNYLTPCTKRDVCSVLAEFDHAERSLSRCRQAFILVGWHGSFCVFCAFLKAEIVFGFEGIVSDNFTE